MRSVYCIELSRHGVPCALFEDFSIHRAVKFLDTIDLDIVDVRFYRHRPFREYNVEDILEVYRNELHN